MTKEDELMEKQVILFSQALSQTLMKETAKCIETDGEVITQAVTVALGKTLGASLAALTRGLPERDVKGITDLVFKLVMGAAKECAEDLKDMGKEN